MRFWKVVSALHRDLRGLLVPLILALPILPNVMDGTERASLTTLGRDQGIFQYVAWAIQKGEVAYRDVRDVNGPLTYMVHLALLALGGRDEHRFRVLDLLITGLSFAVFGACLPGIGRALGRRASALPEDRPVATWVARLGWAGAAWTILSGQLLMYLYWDLAQRETFFDWFLLAGVGIQLVAQDHLRERRPRANAPLGRWLLVLAGALLAAPIFGKPTYALFFLIGALTLAIDVRLIVGLRARLAWFGGGALAGALAPSVFLLRYGDAGAYARILFHDVPLAYRFIMTRTAREILSLQWGGTLCALSAATSLVMIALILEGIMPRRALAIALLPIGGILSVLSQAKGFPYHFHPVSLGLYAQWLALACWAWERFADAPRGTLHRLVPLVGAAVIAGRLAFLLPSSPHIIDHWILEKGATAKQREEHDYLVYFRDRDFFPFEIRLAARFLREHTGEADRVQIYGMDPYVLFLAERLSATPYIYAYDLNADGALSGSWMKDGPHPTEEQARAIKAMRDAHEDDLVARIKRAPPAAFVFFDRAPLVTWEDAVYDFHEQCAEAAEWVDANYRLAATFQEIRVYLRNDLADGFAKSERAE